MKPIVWKIILVAFLIILICLMGLIFWYKQALAAPNKNINGSIVVEIKSTMTYEQIGGYLYDKKVIADKKIFLLSIKLLGKKMNPGFYEILPNMSMAEVIRLIDEKHTKIAKLTFPEGWRAEQIGKKLDESKVVSYADFLVAAQGKEGELFPDTYFFNPIMTGTEVVRMMTDNFDERTAGYNLTDDQLILASIVEREAANDADRTLIAGIYSNRLKASMKMQSDPTVEYGRDTNAIAKLSISDQLDYSFWKSAKTVEYTSVKSPFNTYQVAGLPAGPICNPGLKSIEAAQSPSSTKYYYFLYGRDGKIYPSMTTAEHEALAAKYLW